MSIELIKMNTKSYKIYRSYAVAEYAKDKMASENFTEAEAMEISEESFTSLLPEGVLTAGHYLFDIISNQTKEEVGTLWFAEIKEKSKKYAYVYDLEIKEDHRGKGYGKMMMKLLEDEVKKIGLDSITLNVFGDNKTAISLYDKLDYKVTKQIMTKHI